jgi:hypothetical protein
MNRKDRKDLKESIFFEGFAVAAVCFYQPDSLKESAFICFPEFTGRTMAPAYRNPI